MTARISRAAANHRAELADEDGLSAWALTKSRKRFFAGTDIGASRVFTRRSNLPYEHNQSWCRLSSLKSCSDYSQSASKVSAFWTTRPAVSVNRKFRP